MKEIGLNGCDVLCCGMDMDMEMEMGKGLGPMQRFVLEKAGGA
jgi:hypothetical protein